MDRTLDLVIHADQTISFKDVDELDWAEGLGEYTIDEATWIRRAGRTAHDHFVRGGWPLDVDWDQWRPQSQGSLPQLDPRWAQLSPPLGWSRSD